MDLEKASLKDVKLLWSQCIQYRLSQGPTTFRLPSIRDWSKYDKESQALFGLLFRMRYLSSRKVCLTEDEISVHGDAGVQYPALFNRNLWIPVCNAESSYDDTFGRLLIDYINSGKYDKEFFKKTFLFKNGYIVDIADKGFALSLLAHMNIQEIFEKAQEVYSLEEDHKIDLWKIELFLSECLLNNVYDENFRQKVCEWRKYIHNIQSKSKYDRSAAYLQLLMRDKNR